MLGDIIKAKIYAAVVAAILAAIPLTALAQQPPAAHDAGQAEQSRHEGPVGGYDGWWNSTPTSGDASALPQETVAVNTETNQVVDAFNRRINEAGRPTRLADVPFTVVPDLSWPAKSVVIIDTATKRVIAAFRVDAKGEPVR